MGTYEQLRHTLDTKMLNASNLPSQEAQRGFVAQSFVDIHKAYQEKRISHENYIKLVNRLAAYKQGAFNDYLDTLTGAAQMGMLDVLLAQSIWEDTAEQSRKRSKTVTGLTGMQPIEPEE